MSYITLTPAYGRDYKSKAAVLADWNADKDFVIASIGHPYDGKPMNRADAASTPNDSYNVRYDRLRKITPVTA